MANITISGLELFQGSESYLNDLSEKEMGVTGGLNVNFNSEVGAAFLASDDINFNSSVDFEISSVG